MSALKKWKCRELDSASIAGTLGRIRGLLVPEIAPWGSKIIAFHVRELFAKKMENFRKWGQKNIFTRGKSIFSWVRKKRGQSPASRLPWVHKSISSGMKARVRRNEDPRFRIFDVSFFWAPLRGIIVRGRQRDSGNAVVGLRHPSQTSNWLNINLCSRNAICAIGSNRKINENL